MPNQSSSRSLPSKANNLRSILLSLAFLCLGIIGMADSGPNFTATDAWAGSRQAVPTCGDGIVEGDEDCDDGGAVGGDGCASDCTFEALTCDHGICEQGSPLGGLCGLCENIICRTDSFCCQTSWDDVCVSQVETVCGDTQCTACGNGVLELDEECDDGNRFNKDGCNGFCVEEFCGDGLVNNVTEQCDDGNTVTGDGCSGDCATEASDCSHNLCSSGAPLAPTCTPCVAQICDLDSSCCTQRWDSLCVEAVSSVCALGDCLACGNGALEIDEECDDGNLVNGDGCSSACENEPPPAEICQTHYRFGFEEVAELDGAIGNLIPFALDLTTTVTFQTTGMRGCPGDTVVEIYDSLEDPPLAGDDDGGLGRCSSLVVNLGPGVYSIFVRPFDDSDDFPYLLEIYEEASCPVPTTTTTTTTVIPVPSTTVTSTLPPTTSTTLPPTNCGNGVTESDEECDDGNMISGDGCSGGCSTETLDCGHDVCVEGAALGGNCGACELAVCQDDSFCCTNSWDDQCVDIANTICGGVTCCAHSVCTEGDALVPTCDDCATDVCNEDSFCCEEEWDSTCVDLAEELCDVPCVECGNNNLEGDEECDDGNTVDGDGCSAECVDECGNGSLQEDEDCDDGNRINGDGCDKFCRDECGSGILSDHEECDDGNTISGDGCTVFCELESETCEHSECTLGSPLAGSCSPCSLAVCQATDECCTSQWDEYCLSRAEELCEDLCQGCGNGVRAFDGSEECDDFNNEDGDGCSATCELEPGQLFEACTTRYVSGFRQFGSPTGTFGGFLRLPFELASPTFVQFRADTVRTSCTGPAKISILQGEDEVVVDDFATFGTCPEINQLLPAGSYVFEYSNTQPVFFFLGHHNPSCPAPTTTTTSSTTTTTSTSTTTTTTVEPVCGNGVVELDEECDDGALRRQTALAVNGDESGVYCTTQCVARDCGTPVSGELPPFSSDALWALRASVQLLFCDLRLCDINNDGKVLATDALDLLLLSVALPVELNCPKQLSPDPAQVDTEPRL